MPQVSITVQQLQAIQEIVNYCWSDEQEDFEEIVRNEGATTSESHIFRRLMEVENWLKGDTAEDAISYVAQDVQLMLLEDSDVSKD